MSWSTYGKKHSAKERQPSATAVAEPAINADFPEGYDWRDAWRDHDANADGTRSSDNVQQFVEDQFGFHAELMSDFNGDASAVHEFFSVKDMQSIRGDEWCTLSWLDGDEVERLYTFTQADFDEIANTVIENGWHQSQAGEYP